MQITPKHGPASWKKALIRVHSPGSYAPQFWQPLQEVNTTLTQTHSDINPDEQEK